MTDDGNTSLGRFLLVVAILLVLFAAMWVAFAIPGVMG